jgi:hypothetical protein
VADRVCARPGCGHNRRHVNYTIGGPPVPEDFGHHLDGCHVLTETPEGWMRCPCPVFRTEAQQEAWEDARAQLVLHSPRLRSNDAVERLLELYP